MLFDLSLPRHVLPFAYTLFLWWFSTGVILYLDGLPRRTFRWSFSVATGTLAAALYGLAQSSTGMDVGSAYLAFTCAVLIWGWNEMAFLMGFLTGPRRSPCPEGCRGWSHFRHAFEAILYHELALLVSALGVIALTWEAPNQVGTWTFLVLWWMRLSAKLNVFLGVPNLTEEFVPEHLAYLKRFFTRKPMNLLFPLSVTVSTIATVLLVQAAIDPSSPAAAAVGATLVASLVALALLEHWFMVLPLPAAGLWAWGLRSRPPQEPEKLSSARTP